MDDKSSQTKIGRVEQFMVGLLATPDHTPRLRVLRTKKIFEDLETDYRPTFELLHVATKGDSPNKDPLNKGQLSYNAHSSPNKGHV